MKFLYKKRIIKLEEEYNHLKYIIQNICKHETVLVSNEAKQCLICDKILTLEPIEQIKLKANELKELTKKFNIKEEDIEI